MVAIFDVHYGAGIPALQQLACRRRFHCLQPTVTHLPVLLRHCGRRRPLDRSLFRTSTSTDGPERPAGHLRLLAMRLPEVDDASAD
jgi:hypothetical protein